MRKTARDGCPDQLYDSHSSSSTEDQPVEETKQGHSPSTEARAGTAAAEKENGGPLTHSVTASEPTVASEVPHIGLI